MPPRSHRHVGTHDPAVGDKLLVDDGRFEVVDRCPCGPEARHRRWFLSGHGRLAGVRMPMEACISKEWDGKGQEWWWFGTRIAATDLRLKSERLTERLSRGKTDPPKRLFYEGRLFRLASQEEPAEDARTDDPETVPVTIWEYVDTQDVESILIEIGPEGEFVAYHGWYSNPEDIRIG